LKKRVLEGGSVTCEIERELTEMTTEHGLYTSVERKRPNTGREGKNGSVTARSVGGGVEKIGGVGEIDKKDCGKE